MPLTDEQLAMRKTGIGGSEIGAVAGLAPYSGPMDVYLAKLGLAEVAPSHHLERGNFLEPAILEWYQHRTGRGLCIPSTLRHPKYDIVLATPDAITAAAPDDPPRVVEVKCPGRRAEDEWGEPGSDDVPAHYRAQVMWTMAVTGCAQADLVAFMGGDIHIYTVDFNQRLFDSLLSMARIFWRQHVLPQVPPDVDGSRGADEFIRATLPKDTRPAEQDERAEVAAAVAAYNAASDRMNAAKTLLAKRRQELALLIGDRRGITGEYGSVYFATNRDSIRIDGKKLAAIMQPERTILDMCSRTVPGARVLRAYPKRDSK